MRATDKNLTPKSTGCDHKWVMCVCVCLCVFVCVCVYIFEL